MYIHTFIQTYTYIAHNRIVIVFEGYQNRSECPFKSKRESTEEGKA